MPLPGVPRASRHPGGSSGFFSDEYPGKPWSNEDQDAPLKFWEAKDEWYPTWNGRDAALKVRVAGAGAGAVAATLAVTLRVILPSLLRRRSRTPGLLVELSRRRLRGPSPPELLACRRAASLIGAGTLCSHLGRSSGDHGSRRIKAPPSWVTGRLQPRDNLASLLETPFKHRTIALLGRSVLIGGNSARRCCFRTIS